MYVGFEIHELKIWLRLGGRRPVFSVFRGANLEIWKFFQNFFFPFALAPYQQLCL